jgi:hypothetical protein
VTVFRFALFGVSAQAVGTLLLMIDNFRMAIRLPANGIVLGDSRTMAAFHWANFVGFGFLLLGFVLEAIAICKAHGK